MTKLLKIFFALEFILAMLIISGIAPAYVPYLSLVVLAVGIWKLSAVEALQFFILSIPIFVSLPANSLSDAMSIWRIGLLVLILKAFLAHFDIMGIISEKDSDFSGKKRKLAGKLKLFLSEVRVSNYYHTLTAVLLFALVSWVSLLFAQSVGAGVKKMIFLGGIFLLFGVIYSTIKSREDAAKILRTVFATAIFILFVGYLQLAATFFVTLSDFWGAWDNFVISAFYGGKTMVLLSYSNTWFSYYGSDEIPATLRMFSVMQDSHSFAMLMILFIPLSVYYFSAAKGKFRRIKYAAILVLILLAIFFSGTRGAWMGWAVAAAFATYMYLLPKIPGYLRIFKMQLSGEHKNTYKAVALTIMLFVAMFPVSNYVLNTNQDVQLVREGKMAGGDKLALLKRTWSISDMDETSNKGRMEIWQDSAASVVKRPVLGIGLGNFPLALGEKITTAKLGASAHNIYLDVAVETGLLGLAAFLLILWRIAAKLFSLSQRFRDKNYRMLAASLLVSLVWVSAYGFFDVVIFNDKVLMFTVIILALVYKTEDIEEKEMASDMAVVSQK